MAASRDEYESATGSDSDSGKPGFRARHKFTDLPCALLFFVTIGALGCLVVHAATTSDLKRLTQGIDKDDKICGYKSDFPGSRDPAKGIPNKPFLFFCAQSLVESGIEGTPDVLTVNYQEAVCVAECPKQGAVAAVIAECPVVANEVSNVAYNTKEIQGRFCMPDNSLYKAVAKKVVDDQAEENKDSIAQATEFWEKVSNDQFGLKHGKTVLAVSCLVAIVGGYVYLYTLRLFASCLVYVMVVGTIVVDIVLGYYLFQMKGDGAIEDSAEGTEQAAAGVEADANDQYFKYCAYILWVKACLILALFLFFRNSIKTSIACIQCGAKVIFKMPCLLVSPLLKSLAKVILTLLLLVGALYLAAMGTVHGTTVNGHGGGFARWIEYTDQDKCMIVFYMFGSFWILEFVNALYQFSIAYAVGFYYFSEPDEDDNRDVPCTVVQEGAFVGIFKHTGSLAFGACIIAIIQTIQWILRYLYQKNQEGGGNFVVSCVLKVLMFCCACLEQVMGFINKNVYIDIAISGDHGFCSGLRNVVKTIIDWGTAMAILAGANFLFKWTGVAMLSGGCGGIAWLMLQDVHYALPDSETRVEGKEFLIGFCMLVGLMTGWAFMEAFQMTTDTLLYCFATDKANNDGHVTTAPADFLSLYNDAEEILHKREKKRAKLLAKRESQY